jgi:hypothetical protein
MTEEPTPIQISAAALSEARWKTGELWVYRHDCRCPHCHRWWAFEVAAPRGTIAPDVAPAKAGMGLLCGECTAKRIALAVYPRTDGGNAGIMRFWTDQDERNAWGRLRHGNGYAPRITRLAVWDRSTPLADDQRARMDEILNVDGRRLPGITPRRAQRLGLDWQTHEIERGER